MMGQLLTPSGWFRAPGTSAPAESTEGRNQKTEQMRLENGCTISPLLFVAAAADASDLLGLERPAPDIFRTV